MTHAAGESGPATSGTHAVVLAVPKERLRYYSELLSKRSLPFVEICEISPPYNGELLAIGIKPGPQDEIRRCVSDLPLLR